MRASASAVAASRTGRRCPAPPVRRGRSPRNPGCRAPADGAGTFADDPLDAVARHRAWRPYGKWPAPTGVAQPLARASTMKQGSLDLTGRAKTRRIRVGRRTGRGGITRAARPRSWRQTGAALGAARLSTGGRPWWPCGRGTRGSACGERCWVEVRFMAIPWDTGAEWNKFTALTKTRKLLIKRQICQAPRGIGRRRKMANPTRPPSPKPRSGDGRDGFFLPAMPMPTTADRPDQCAVEG